MSNNDKDDNNFNPEVTQLVETERGVLEIHKVHNAFKGGKYILVLRGSMESIRPFDHCTGSTWHEMRQR